MGGLVIGYELKSNGLWKGNCGACWWEDTFPKAEFVDGWCLWPVLSVLEEGWIKFIVRVLLDPFIEILATAAEIPVVDTDVEMDDVDWLSDKLWILEPMIKISKEVIFLVSIFKFLDFLGSRFVLSSATQAPKGYGFSQKRMKRSRRLSKKKRV